MIDDPLSLDLKSLFRDKDMFDSADNWSDAGFKIVRESDSETKILVAGHKKADGYLFKKYLNLMPLEDQLERYTRRLEGATKLRALIEQRNLKHIVVPRKWLYELPRRFTLEMPSYIVIVQEFSIPDRESLESEHSHRRIDSDVLRELCVIWFEFRGLDFTAKNAPFTKRGQVAFIDTEYLDWQDSKARKNKNDDPKRQQRQKKKSIKKREARYMKYAQKYLTGSKLKLAETMFKELSAGL